MDFAQVSIAIAQILIFVANALIYSRQKSALDVEKRDRGSFGVTVSDVARVARDAASKIDSLTYTHYEALRTKYETLLVEYRDLQAHVRGLEESISSLSNKLASRDRADSARERRALEREALRVAPANEKDDEAADGSGDPLAGLIASGAAIPLRPQGPPETSSLPNHFGQAARRKA